MVSQSIPHPFGINVFGSAIMRIEPDVASLNFAVSRLAQHPKQAFEQTHTAAAGIRRYLSQLSNVEVSSSRVTLTEHYKYIEQEHKFLGYLARMGFHVLLRDLNQMEDLLSGAVDAGVNHIDSVEYQTSRLKEVRAEARRRAVLAAREKAELYCASAGVSLAPVLHIEDVDPNQLRRYEGHTIRETQYDDEGQQRAFDPGSITIGAAVMLAFELERS